MNSLHPLLRRQLKRHFGDVSAIPGELLPFVDIVSGTYAQADVDRTMLERSLDLSSQELIQANRDMAEAIRALREAGHDLERRVAERTAELTAAHDQLRQAQKMDAIGRLAGGIAHDFNNLLTAIHGFAELLIDGLAPHDHRREDVQEIIRAADRATMLTRQLLAFSRKQVLSVAVVDLGEVVRGLTPMLGRLLGETIRLETITHNQAHVKADVGQLEQVLVNLAVNARDAMPGGGQLTIETSDVLLGEDYAELHPPMMPGPHVLLAVSDTGHGMDAATQARLFEPFFSTKPKGHGTGLGLAMVYGIVKQSSGFVWVYSEVGHGSTFKIYLPKTDGACETSHASTRIDPSEIRGLETILVVEDERSVREFVERVLTRHGYTVYAAADPREALELAQREQASIQLLLSDVVLPNMSGKVLATKLLERRPALKVLYMSGYTDDAIVNHGVLEPSTWFLQKPFTSDALGCKIREVLDHVS